MNLVFTLCSNNYLAQAKILLTSFKKYHPDYTFVIGLVDKMAEGINYDEFSDGQVIPVEELGIPNFDELCKRYNVVELNTSVKASYFLYIKQKFPGVTKVIYLDPDIKVFNTLDAIWTLLDTKNIVVTPHILNPISPDNYTPQENIFLNYGIYNLGFLGVNISSTQSVEFLKWWENRILNFGYNRVQEGYFVDQLWINLAPLFFDKVAIIREPGYNMAPWNLHERVISSYSESKILVNGDCPLFFYHFSSFSYKTPESICKPYYNRFTFDNRPDLKPIYETYVNEIIAYGAAKLSGYKCELLIEEPIVAQQHSLSNKIKFWCRQLLPPIITRKLTVLD